MNRMTIVSGVAIVLSGIATTWVHAEPHKASATQGPVRINKITCKDFLVLDQGERLKFLYWVEGFSQKGPEDEAVFDFAKTEQLVSAVTHDCNQEPYALVWKKVKAERQSERGSTPAATLETSGGGR